MSTAFTHLLNISLFFLPCLFSLVHFGRYIKRGQPDAGFPLFETEPLRFPGFVEFDDVNGKVLMYNPENRYFTLVIFCWLTKIHFDH